MAPHLVWLLPAPLRAVRLCDACARRQVVWPDRAQRARLSGRLVRLCGDPGDDRAGRRAPRRRNCSRHGVAGRPDAGWRRRLSGDPCRCPSPRALAERHRHHLAVVDVGLDALAGAAAVAAGIDPREIDTRRLLAAVAAIPFVMPIASPAIAIIAQRNDPQPAAAQANLLAGEVERVWHETTTLPLRFVGGAGDLADGVITYAADRPRALPDMPRIGTPPASRAADWRSCVLPRPPAAATKRARKPLTAARRDRDRAQFSRIFRQAAALHDLHRAAALRGFSRAQRSVQRSGTVRCRPGTFANFEFRTPLSAVHHFVLRRIRGTKPLNTGSDRS